MNSNTFKSPIFEKIKSSLDFPKTDNIIKRISYNISFFLTVLREDLLGLDLLNGKGSEMHKWFFGRVTKMYDSAMKNELFQLVFEIHSKDFENYMETRRKLSE